MNLVIAAKLETALDKEGLPDISAWEKASPVTFCTDWRGEDADPMRETQVRLLWSNEHLYVRFLCRYHELYVYPDNNSRRDRLWLRDVAEAFVRTGTDELRHYKEFEISPNGDWLDLDIDHGEKSDLLCSLKSRVIVSPDTRIWTAELAIPISCVTASFSPDDIWRLNLFRIEGRDPHRFYSAWQPTHTAIPNFHVPELFGELRFSDR